ncbi:MULTISPECIES: hypothetical protein [unclassified Vibrio]|jgi:hypothetical protein|nr:MULTISPECIES: hypothetical protein [unclassified Vibrio]MBR9790045.1 hypothetical protein [Vibrionaceae bacterium]MBR9873125.1 hypothetical protein [Vibrionaceae bacterium]MCF7482113.1 hypothetical protein [Vibrio sp. J1-1]
MNSALLSILDGKNNLELGKVLTPSISAALMCFSTTAVIGLLSLISMA